MSQEAEVSEKDQVRSIENDEDRLFDKMDDENDMMIEYEVSLVH